MRPIHRALLGALLLCALLSLAACTTDGDKRKPLPGATETVLVEVPRRQLVRVSGELTAVPALTPAPVPATPYGPNCTRRAGCYSNRQLEAMLNSALGWGETMTYGEIARALDAGPEAARTVGEAMARNPVPLIIPCHRVTAAGGKIGGFSAPGGSMSKVRMLELEWLK